MSGGGDFNTERFEMSTIRGARKIQVILTPINRVMTYVSGFFFMIMMLITVYEVIVRYAFNAPTVWTLEVSQYLMVIAIFFGVAYTLEADSHIKVDLLVTRLSPQRQRILGIIASILGIIFCAILLWKTAQLAGLAYQMHWISVTVLKVYLFPIYLVMPIGSFFLLLQYIVKLLMFINRQ